MYRTLGAALCILAFGGVASCTTEAEPEETIMTETPADTTTITDSLTGHGWEHLQHGSTGALNAEVEMEKKDGEGVGSRFIIQSRTTNIDPEQMRAQRMENLEVDPDAEAVVSAGTQEFGSETGYGLQYVNTSNDRATQSWYVRHGENLLTITIDYPGTDIPDDALEALDEVKL